MPALVRAVGIFISFLFCFINGVASAQATDKSFEISIPAGDLANALETLGAQSGVQIMYEPAVAQGIRVAAINGTLTVRNALKQLLAETDLKADQVNEKTVVLKRAEATEEPQSAKKVQEESSGANSTPQQAAGELEEIVVTAQKREERLQDVPASVTALTAGPLTENNQVRLQDYYTKIPGLSLTGQGFSGSSVVSMRGMITGTYSNPTVGTVIDDLPYGASTEQGGGVLIPDVDPSDMARIEVLRGPQGTLYGASSVGGLMKYTTLDPSTERTSGSLQAGLSSTSDGGVGNSVRASINLPVSDTVAVRASGFTRRDPGYVDNPVTGVDDVNQADVTGGRIAALWRPSSSFSLKLTALTQHGEQDGSLAAYTDPGSDKLLQNSPRGTGTADIRIQAFGAHIVARVGDVEITSISGYTLNKLDSSFDAAFFDSASQSLFGADGTGGYAQVESKKVSQEVRATAPIGERLNWWLGAFYTKETGDYNQQFFAVDRHSGTTVGGPLLTTLVPTELREYAGFLDITYDLTERMEIQLGGRQSQIRQTVSGVFEGIINSTRPDTDAEGNPFTYLASLRFKATPDLTTYVRLASGYRAGGPNAVSAEADSIPQYHPDKAYNYEVGAKGTLFDRALSFDAALYYIDWQDLQLYICKGLCYVGNAGRASSQGVELSFNTRPFSGFTISGSLSYNDAKLTEDLPPDVVAGGAYGVSGDRLPFSSQWSGNISLEQEFGLWSTATGFAGGTISYVGDRLGEFTAGPQIPRTLAPSYVRADLHVGFRQGDWNLNAYVNNATDRRGVLGGGNFNTTLLNYIQPRTIGLSISRSF